MVDAQQSRPEAQPPSPASRRPAPRTWAASWIWPRDRREPNLHLLFRKDFTVASGASTALLHIAAESAAQVVLNGHELGRTAANSYPGQHYYETYDCRPALAAGVNRLAIIVRYIGIPSSASIPKDPGLLCELEIEEGGTRRCLGSDASWLCLPLDAWRGRHRRSEWLNLDLVEIVDRRLLPAGFPYPEHIAGFVAPESLPWPGVRFTGMEPRTFAKPAASGMAGLTLLAAGTVADRSAAVAIPALAMSEEDITPRTFAWDGSGDFTIPAQPAGTAFTLVLGMDGYWNGRPSLEASGPAGATVDIAWHEMLTAGRFDVRGTKVYTADRFILAEGANPLTSEDWMCGRYLQLTFRGLTAPLRVRRLRFTREEYPLRQRLEFSSSDRRLERIVAIGLAAARRCMHDNIMDCPWRERRQWIGDVQRIALISHLAFGDRDLVRAVLRQHVQLQDPSGRMWVCVPIWEEYPTQSMEWLRAVLEYRQCTGDGTLLDEVFDNAEMLHRWFLRQRDRQGLLFIDSRPVMNWMDNPYARIRRWQFETAYLAQNLRYLLFLDDMAECFRIVGRPGEAERAQAERVALAGRIAARFTDGATGLLRDCAEPGIPPTFSEMGHALAICAGLDVAGGQAALWQRFTAFALDHPAELIRASPFGAYHVHQALARLGKADEIVRDILDRWGPMVEAGAETTWERFADQGAGVQSQQGSHCHGWAGIPAVSLAHLVLGLEPGKPGRARQERTGGVAWIEMTRRGD